MNDYSPAFLVYAADIGYLRRTAMEYKSDAIIIKNNDYSRCTPTFHLLSSLAFELLPKILIGYEICLKYKNDYKITEEEVRNEIATEIKKYNHNLDRLYLNFPDLMNFLNIKTISGFDNGFVWDYRIELGKDNKVVSIKDIEAIRYGSFAKNRDILTWCEDDNILVELLDKLEQYIINKEHETNMKFKK